MEFFWRDLLGDKWGGLVAKYLPIICLIIVAYIAIKVIMKFVDKLIVRSKMPKSAHVFARTTVKVILYLSFCFNSIFLLFHDTSFISFSFVVNNPIL